MLVEHSEDDAQLILHELRRGGYEPTWERVDTASALTVALARGEWDLITCDWVMPQFSAPAALEVIREQGFDGPVIIVSGQVGEEVAVTALKAGADDWVGKRNLTRLVPAVARELRGVERRRAHSLAEEQRHEAEERFRCVVESSQDGIVVYDTDFRLTLWNSTLERMSGLRREEVFGRNAFEVFPFLDTSGEAGAMREAVKGNATGVSEGTYDVPETGRRGCFESSHLPMRDSRGQLVGGMGVIRDTTERKRVEKALRESEEKFRSLVENIPDFILMLKPDGRISYVNRLQPGLTLDQVIGTEVYDLVSLEDRETLRGAILRAAKTGEMSTCETRGIGPDDRLSWYSNRVGPINRDNRLVALTMISTDLTEYKRAEEALRESARELKSRNSIANIFLTIPDDKRYVEVLKVLLEVSESRYGVFGYLDDKGAYVVASMTRDIWDQCQVSDKDMVFPREKWGDSIWPRAIREKRTLYSNEPSTLNPEGHIPITRNITVPIISGGDVVGLFQVANKETDYGEKDIQLMETLACAIAPVLRARLERDRQEKDRERAEEKLRASEQRYRWLVKETTAMVWTSDTEGTFTVLHVAWEAQTGQALDQYLASGWDLAIHEEDRDWVMTTWAQKISEWRPFEIEFRLWHAADAKYHCVVSRGVPLREPDGSVREWVGTITDVEDQKQAEAERQRAALLEQSLEKEKELGELKLRFLSMASHELRTPLTVIRTMTDLIKRHGLKMTDAERSEYLDKVQAQVAHLTQLLDDVLAVSKTDAGKVRFEPTTVDLEALCRHLAQEAEIAHAPHRVIFSYDGPDASVAMDDKLLRNILSNLLSNGAKFSPEQSPVHFHVGRENGAVRFRIEDKGIGIPEEDRERLFEPFHRAGNVTTFAGPGLGMAIVKRAVELHRGTISVESAVNQGTTVTVTIPVAEHAEGHDDGQASRH